MAVWATKCTTSPQTPVSTSTSSLIITHPISKWYYLLCVQGASCVWWRQPAVWDGVSEECLQTEWLQWLADPHSPQPLPACTSIKQAEFSGLPAFCWNYIQLNQQSAGLTYH
jgi:hypothetical protein